MSCTCPLEAWPPAPGSESRRFVFSPRQSYAGAASISIPCGQCLGCRLDRSRAWGVRIMHEAQLAGPGRAHFALLTLSPEWLEKLEADEPARPRNSLWKPDVQRFMKRLRNRVGEGVKSFTGAEYGDERARPHYHACLMHLDLPDLEPWKRVGSGNVVYRSQLLEQVWPFGYVHVGTLTQQSAEYAARYAVKKANGALADEVYARVDEATGEVSRVVPEFALMSKGLGKGWFERFASDCHSGFVIQNGRKVPVPRYYRVRLPEAVQLVQRVRGQAHARSHAAEHRDSRLLVKHQSRELKAARLVREFDQ